jgi:mannose-6-phosphate isomerase-like protein (cupin superfamily)
MSIIHSIRHEKGWGHELWIVNNELYCGKVLSIGAKKRCSLHYHELKTETMFLTKGRVEMTFGSLDMPKQNIVVLEVGDVFHIPPFLVHQFLALEDSEIIEFSTQHFESDSHRLEKGD